MSSRLFIASFSREQDVVSATRDLRERGYAIRDVLTPYAVHGLDAAMGQRPSRLPLVCLAFGLFGAIAKLSFQVWTSAIDWPVNIGGKPLASIPAFVPVTFEVTVLFAGLGTVAAFLLRSRLWPGKQPALSVARTTDDRFAVVLEETDASFDPVEVKRLCAVHGCVHTEERTEETP